MTETDNKLIITRVFNAPHRLVWKAWTEAEYLKQWWGPQGFTNPICEIDVRPGGAIRIHMRGPDGTVYPMSGVYHEIVEYERLVFTSAALDEKGDPLFEVSNTILFAENDGKTILTMHASVSKVTAKAAPYLAGMEAGWKQSLDRLDLFAAEHVGGRVRFVSKWSAWAPYLLSVLRMVSAFMFMLTGTMKLFAFPAGIPPNGGTVPLMSQLGIGGVLEAFGGALLLLGLFTRPVAFLLAGEMAVAYFQFHFPGGYWPIMNGGMPAVLYCFIWLYFSAAGAGPWSLDAKRKK